MSSYTATTRSTTSALMDSFYSLVIFILPLLIGGVCSLLWSDSPLVHFKWAFYFSHTIDKNALVEFLIGAISSLCLLQLFLWLYSQRKRTSPERPCQEETPASQTPASEESGITSGSDHTGETHPEIQPVSSERPNSDLTFYNYRGRLYGPRPNILGWINSHPQQLSENQEQRISSEADISSLDNSESGNSLGMEGNQIPVTRTSPIHQKQEIFVMVGGVQSMLRQCVNEICLTLERLKWITAAEIAVLQQQSGNASEGLRNAVNIPIKDKGNLTIEKETQPPISLSSVEKKPQNEVITQLAPSTQSYSGDSTKDVNSSQHRITKPPNLGNEFQQKSVVGPVSQSGETSSSSQDNSKETSVSTNLDPLNLENELRQESSLSTVYQSGETVSSSSQDNSEETPASTNSDTLIPEDEFQRRSSVSTVSQSDETASSSPQGNSEETSASTNLDPLNLENEFQRGSSVSSVSPTDNVASNSSHSSSMGNFRDSSNSSMPDNESMQNPDVSNLSHSEDKPILEVIAKSSILKSLKLCYIFEDLLPRRWEPNDRI